MSIKDGFIIKEIMGQTVVVPVGENSKQIYGMIKLNATGAEIWKGVAGGLSEDEIAAKLVEKYAEVDLDTALEAVNRMIKQMDDAGILES